MQDSKTPLMICRPWLQVEPCVCPGQLYLLGRMSCVHMDPASWVVCGWSAMLAHQMVSAAELVVTGKQRSRFFKSFNSVYSCVTPPVKAVLIVITVIQLCITLSASTIVVQILIQGKIQLINILQRNCLNKTAFLLIVSQKNCRVLNILPSVPYS